MAQPKLTEDMNIIQRGPLEITTLNGDLDIIAKLDDEPNDVGGLTSAQLKAEFDKAGNIIKTYLNDTLIPELLASDAVEQARVTAETAREQAEQDRAAAETERARAEQDRAAAEAARASWGEYDSGTAYVPGSKAAYGGSSYVCMAPAQGIPPTDTAHWLLIAQRGENGRDGQDGQGTGDMLAAAYDPTGQHRDIFAHEGRRNNPHGVTAAQVHARPDTWMPTAAEVQAIPAAQKGVPNGVATLDASGRVPAGQLGGCPAAEVRMIADPGTTVTMERDGRTLTGTVSAETGYAVLHPDQLGDWTLSYQFNGAKRSKVFSVEVVGIMTVHPFLIASNLESTSWADIASVSDAGLAEQYFQTGDTKNIKVNGVTYPVQIIGFQHDDRTAGGRAGITFQLVNSMKTAEKMESSNSTKNGWDGCLMRKTTLPKIYNQLEPALRAAIKPVNKLTYASGTSHVVKTSSDKLFLLSKPEIFGGDSGREGRQYAWYHAGNGKIKQVNGEDMHWWTRTPVDSERFCYVDWQGKVGSYYANNTSGVSFAFCV